MTTTTGTTAFIKQAGDAGGDKKSQSKDIKTALRLSHNL
jgi:hypothetical protein